MRIEVTSEEFDYIPSIKDKSVHVIAFAEEGFSFFKAYCELALGFSMERAKILCEQINQADEARTLWPKGTLTALPKRFFRDETWDKKNFSRCIRDAFIANRDQCKSLHLAFMFFCTDLHHKNIVREIRTLAGKEFADCGIESIRIHLSNYVMNNHDTAEKGRTIIEDELLRKGVTVKRVKRTKKTILSLQESLKKSDVEVIAKTKTGRGNWHTNIKEGKRIQTLPTPDNELEYWVFVNLNNLEKKPSFWIVPGTWMRNNIAVSHEEYLRRNNGKRKKNNASTHHSISEADILEWKDRWDLISGL